MALVALALLAQHPGQGKGLGHAEEALGQAIRDAQQMRPERIT